MFYASVVTDKRSNTYFTHGYAHKYTNIHKISAIKGVNNQINMPTCTVDTHTHTCTWKHTHTQTHTMIMHTNHSTNTRKVFTITKMAECIEWTLEVVFSTVVL